MSLEDEPKKKQEVIIREMDIDDISAVYHLGENLFTSEEFPILYRTWDAFEVTDYFSSDPDYCFVAESDGRVVGFVIGTIIKKEGTAWKRYGYVSWIGVNEDFQRTNLGFRLYQKLEKKLQDDGVRMMIADTDAGNIGALAFFKDVGFSQSAQHIWLAKTLRKRSKRNVSHD
jgi:ribosomal protein S18 acetylase RimI-like enzyme